MSNGREFQRTDAATGNERRPTVDRRKDGTRSDCDVNLNIFTRFNGTCVLGFGAV